MPARVGGALALLLVAHALLWWDRAPVLDAAALLLIGAAVPGYLLVCLLLGAVPTGSLERALYAAGAGCGLLVVGMLLLSYLPGPLVAWQAFALFDGLALLLAALLLLRGRAPVTEPEPRALWAAAALVVLAALALRLPGLGYSEFHGDEARGVLRAAAVLQGYEETLFLHRKGPAEILLPAAHFALGGTISEDAARLPFAVANIAALLTALLIGWRAWGLAAGLAAALLLTIDGYFVAFARFVQYQSIVLLVAALAVLLLVRLYQTGSGARPRLALAALLLATGLLAHWDALAVWVPVGFLWLALGVRRMGWRALLRESLPALLLGGALLALYFAPLAAHPAWQGTVSYLRSERIGGGAPYNNLPDFLARDAFYSSIWLVALMGLLLLGAALRVIVRRRVDAVEAALWFWLLLPLAGMLFFVATPRTHVHVFSTPWALLAGGAAGAAWAWLQRAVQPTQWPTARALTSLATAALFLFLALHPLFTFAYNRQEFVRASAPQWLRTLYPQPGSSAAVDGRFGFPFANGWKAVGVAYADGTLHGDFETNQRYAWVPAWYTRGETRCAATAAWYFAVDALEPWAEGKEAVADRIQAQGLAPLATVTVRGAPRLLLYGSAGRPDALAETLPLENYAARFDALASPALPLDYPTILPPMEQPSGADFGGVIVLEGSTLDAPARPQPGDVLRLRLFWRAQRELAAAYTVFTQVYDATGRMIAQNDGMPVCDQEPTNTWEPGETIVDTRALFLAADAPPGRYLLVAGLYDAESGERLPLLDGSGAPVDDKVQLGEILIE